jgi:uncharacterized membrane protein YfhO
MRKLLFFILVTLALALLPIMALRGDLWLSSDFVHQQVSFILETKRMLASGAPWWSWNTYLGSDFIGSYAFYTLTSPFVWINCLFPESLLEVGLSITFVLKFLCLGWLSLVYLGKMGVSKANSVFGSYLFIFSSFSIASLYYYHFYEPIIAFLLLLIAVERLLRCKRWGMTCVALATFAVVFVNFYFAVGTLIFTLIYVIFRAFSSDIDFSFKTAIKGIVAVLVGIIMCSVLLLPVFHQMLVTTRADAQNVVDMTAILNMLERLRTLFMPKVVEGVTVFVNGGSGSFSNEACIAVFGLSLALVYAWRHRDWLSWLLVTMLVLYLTPLNGIFTLFTNPLYTRWAYALTLMIVLCTARTLDDGRNVKRGVVSYSILASSVVIVFVAKVIIGNGLHFPGPRFLALIALFFAGIMALVLWARSKISLSWLKVSVAVCVVGQMWLFLLNLHSINEDNFYAKCVDGIELNSSKVVTYRTDFRNDEYKDIFTYNLGILRNLSSVQGYNSVITLGVDSLYNTVTRNSRSTNKLSADTCHDEFDALLSVKDIYEFDSAGNLTKRDNRYYIPFGFTYDSYVTRDEFNKVMSDSTRSLPLLMLANLVVEDGDVAAFKGLVHGTTHQSLSLDSVVAARKRVTTSEFVGDSRGYKAQVDVPKETVMFFSVPFAKGFSATIDGKPATIYKANLCMQALKLPKGKHTIVASYFPPGLKTGAWISLTGILLLMLIILNDNRNKRRNR